MRVRKAAVIGIGFLTLASTAFAGPWGSGGGMAVQDAPVNIEAVKKFQNETTALRNEMMIKRVELRNEQLNQPVDAAKIATLTKEMTDLRTEITTNATSNGLSSPGGGGCGMGMGGKMGKGRGMGRMHQASYQNR